MSQTIGQFHLNTLIIISLYMHFFKCFYGKQWEGVEVVTQRETPFLQWKNVKSWDFKQLDSEIELFK